MKNLALLLFLLGLHRTVAAEPPALELVAEVKGFASPESVAWDGTYYYVSNVGKELKPYAKDGDGFISRMDAKGANLQLDFISKLNAPKGLMAVGNTLYVCDIDTLLGFDIATRKKTLEISFAKDRVQLLNDVCAAEEGKLLVSATDKNKIYLIDLAGKTSVEVKFDKAPIAPNGLAYTNRFGQPSLFVAGWGTDNLPNGVIFPYTLDQSLLSATRQHQPEAMKSGHLDGVAFAFPAGYKVVFLYSNWVDFKLAGKLCCFYSARRPIQSLPIPKGPVAGPADFLYVAETSMIALPCMMEGRILLMELQFPKSPDAPGADKEPSFEEKENAEMDLDREIQAALVGIMGQDGSGRAMSFHGLQNFGPMAKPAIPKLTEALKHKDSYIRVQAAYTIWTIDRQAAMIDRLIEALNDTRIESSHRAMSAEFLGMIGPRAKAAVQALTGALKDAEALIRVSAAWALLQIDQQAGAVKPVFMDALASNDLNVFERAAYTLGTIGFDKASASALAKAIKADPSRRGSAADRAVPALALTLKDRDVDTRKAAIDALAALDPWCARAAVPALIGALKDPDATVRAGATAALRKIDPGAAAKAGSP